MSRNPHATNLRHHRQQIIADKRGKGWRRECERIMRFEQREARECPTGTSAT